MASGYVSNVHRLCSERGCQYVKALSVLTEAERVISKYDNKERSEDMSDNRALYCEYKGDGKDGHSFPAKRGYVELEVRIHNYPSLDDGDTRTFCVPHAQAARLIPGVVEPVAELNSGQYAVDKETFDRYTRHLESQEMDLG